MVGGDMSRLHANGGTGSQKSASRLNRNHLVAALRHHGGKACNHDAEAAAQI